MEESEIYGVRFGPDGAEMEHALDHLTASRSRDVGRALAHHHRVGEAVLAALEAGANPEDVVAALIMVGAVERTTVRRRGFKLVPPRISSKATSA